MDAFKKLTVVLAAVVLVLTVAVGPAVATESGGGGGGGEDGPQKIRLVDNQRDFVGLILFGTLGIGGLLALGNARKQLRGERRQASGEFRWR